MGESPDKKSGSLDNRSRTYAVSSAKPDRSVVLQAIESVLHVLGWQRCQAGTEQSLVVIDRSSGDGSGVNREFLRFCHQAGGHMLRDVLLLDVSHEDAYLQDDEPWLRRVTESRTDIVRLLDWLGGVSESPRACSARRYSTPKPKQCRELIEPVLCNEGLHDLASVVRNIYGDSRCGDFEPFISSDDVFSFYRTLVSICDGHEVFMHRVRKDRAAIAQQDSSSDTSQYRKARSTSLVSQEETFRCSCESIRRSLANPVLRPPNERQNVILVIDDKPREYEEQLRAVCKAFLDDFEIWLWEVGSGNDDQSSALAFLTGYSSIRHASIADATLFPAHLIKLGQKAEGYTSEPLSTVFSRARFVLVDQMYERKDGRGEFHGPAIIRSVSRILRDFAVDGQTIPTDLPEILALSRAEDPEVIQQALRSGARDFVLKSHLLSLPAILAKVQRVSSDATQSYHRPFRRLYALPNETIGLLQTVRVPRIPFHKADATDAGDICASNRTERVVNLIKSFPKPDLHVHAGSCMSPEFLVVASLVGLLRHDWDAVGATIRDVALMLRDQIDKHQNDWIGKVSKDVLKTLSQEIEETEPSSGAYSSLRARLQEQLGIPDFVDPDNAKARLRAKPLLELALFHIRNSVGGELKDDDLVRIYLLVLATRYPGWRLLSEEMDLLDLFRNTAPTPEIEAAWGKARTIFYEVSQQDYSVPSMTIKQFSTHGWRLCNILSLSGLRLDRPSTQPQQRGSCLGTPDFSESPIEYELATGSRSGNLMEYLQGCEFSGAKHLRHPFLIHLYAQQTVMDFIRSGTFYAELKASPGGYINPDLGLEFSHACTCIVEAFGQAQEIVMDVFRQSHAAGTGTEQNSHAAWLGDVLGSRYTHDDLKRLFSHDSSDAASPADSVLNGHLPCKVSLVFVGKRHKATRAMILEAAAAAVMRPAGETPVANAREFVDKEMCRCRVVGFDLAGREYDNPPELFAEEFARLSRLHIPLTIHAGENAPASFIEDAILLLRARRIGHGLSLAQDRNLMTRVREERVCIELCPVGNHQTSHFAPPGSKCAGRRYPLKDYLDHGIYVSIGTDNPVISSTNLVKEYLQASYAYSDRGMTLWDVMRIMRMGYACSFLHLPERRAMLELVEQYLFDIFSDDKVVALLRDLADQQPR